MPTAVRHHVGTAPRSGPRLRHQAIPAPDYAVCRLVPDVQQRVSVRHPPNQFRASRIGQERGQARSGAEPATRGAELAVKRASARETADEIRPGCSRAARRSDGKGLTEEWHSVLSWSRGSSPNIHDSQKTLTRRARRAWRLGGPKAKSKYERTDYQGRLHCLMSGVKSKLKGGR